MEEMMYQKNYEEYRAELGQELYRTAENFVRIGYLLRVARDTDILRTSGYSGYLDFAQGEYGLDKSQVSRFIRINERYSEGGNSDRLMEQYQGFGVRKLSEMLLLPDAVAEELSPAYTVEELAVIREEVAEAQAITPIEAYVEEQEAQDSGESDLERAIFRLGKDDPQLFLKAADRSKEIYEIMAPQGEATYSVRIPGKKLLLICKKEGIAIVDARTGERDHAAWTDVENAWDKYLGDGSRRAWEAAYGEPFSEKEPEKPAQPEKKAEKKPEKPKKETKVHRKEKKVEREETVEEALPASDDAGVPEEPPAGAEDEIRDPEGTWTELYETFEKLMNGALGDLLLHRSDVIPDAELLEECRNDAGALAEVLEKMIRLKGEEA